MDKNNRVAVIGIIISDISRAAEVNSILHDFSDYIIGRMGIPYRKRDLNIISIAVDAPLDLINELNGKLGQLDNVSVQIAFSKTN